MSNVSLFMSLPLGIIGFLFLFWRRLKEDYSSTQIFSFGFTLTAFILIGFFLGLFARGILSPWPGIFNPQGLWFWGSFIFASIGFEVAYLKFKLRFFETLEAASLGFIVWFLIFLALNLLFSFNIKSLIFTFIYCLLIPLFYFVDSRYKTFTWYKSGKIGFTGLTIFGFFFLARSAVAILDPAMLSFIGKFDAIFSSIISFSFFIMLYNLSSL